MGMGILIRATSAMRPVMAVALYIAGWSMHWYCDALSSLGFKDLICYPGDSLYEERIATYWSLAAQKRPHYIVHPKTTANIVQVVKTLKLTPDCQFSVRSGGHVIWGASNITDGVTIDLGIHMTTVSYNAVMKLVSLQPGARWADVYSILEPQSLMVAGGRSGEVVLADGRVVNANKDENADLWRALKGASAGNFGIVTRFDVATIPYDPILAGMLVSDTSTTKDHISSMYNFANNLHKHPDSSCILLWNHEPTTFKNIVITSFAANTKGREETPELKQLLNVPTIIRDMKLTTMTDFSKRVDQPMGYHNYWHTTTFINDQRIMQKAVDVHAAYVAKIQEASKTGHFSSLCLFQALPPFYGRLGVERGGNVKGLNHKLPEDGPNAISLLLSFNISEPDLVELGEQMARAFLDEVEAFAKEVGGFIDWTYINYADKCQNPLRSIGEANVAFAKAVTLKYDPEGFFQRQSPGGFKISKC